MREILQKVNLYITYKTINPQVPAKEDPAVMPKVTNVLNTILTNMWFQIDMKVKYVSKSIQGGVKEVK